VRQVLTGAVLGAILAALALLVAGLTGFGGLAAVLVPLALVVSLAGLALPNTPALALTRHGEAAGTAAVMLAVTVLAALLMVRVVLREAVRL
jgi:MFS transporter, DHA1 family, multidrug resistance protein